MRRRRTGMRLAPFVFAAAVMLAACGDPADTATDPPTDTTVSTPTESDGPLGPGSWEGARTSADGREVVIAFVGGREYKESDPCSVRYDAKVTESTAEVRVAITAKSPPRDSDEPVACTMEGHFRTLRLRLDAPLGERALMEAQFNRAHRVFRDVLWEPSLPAGYRLLHEGPGSFGPREEMRSWMRAYGPDRRTGDRDPCRPGKADLWLTQTDPDVMRPPGYERSEHDASYSWVVDGVGFSVKSMGRCAGDELHTEAELRAFAESVKRP